MTDKVAVGVAIGTMVQEGGGGQSRQANVRVIRDALRLFRDKIVELQIAVNAINVDTSEGNEEDIVQIKADIEEISSLLYAMIGRMRTVENAAHANELLALAALTRS